MRKHQPTIPVQERESLPQHQATIISRTQHNISKTDISANALKVLNRLLQYNFTAYLVGGGVRDLLLRVAPKDFDVATNARPNQIRKLFRNSRLIGRRFRIAHIQFGREIIEVTTFRSGDTAEESEDLKTHEGMIIEDNVYGDIHQDAWRRDFTINSLYYNIADSSIEDYTGGFEDLKTHTLRLIGEPAVRYQEDPVRMLRAVRFCAKLNFHMHHETAEPITSMAQLLKKISRPRLFDEVVKLYHSGKGLETHKLLCQYNLFPQLFPYTARLLIRTNTRTQELIHQTLENTDSRINSGKPVTLAFLLAAFLWHPLLKEIEKLEKQHDMQPLLAIEKAMNKVINMQNQYVAIPKRYTQVMREIWILQYRFPRRLGKRPLRILEHPRFRAAYDFLLIRTIIGEESLELAEWWATFQESDEATRYAMLNLKYHVSDQDHVPDQADEI